MFDRYLNVLIKILQFDFIKFQCLFYYGKVLHLRLFLIYMLIFALHMTPTVGNPIFRVRYLTD